MRSPSQVEQMTAELRELSKEVVFDSAMSDAFEVDEAEWFETTS